MSEKIKEKRFIKHNGNVYNVQWFYDKAEVYVEYKDAFYLVDSVPLKKGATPKERLEEVKMFIQGL